jgi:hypothetical protein
VWRCEPAVKLVHSKSKPGARSSAFISYFVDVN